MIGPDLVVDNPPPTYPPDELGPDRPDVVIDALLIVGADGEVQEVRIAPGDAEGPTAPFARAIVAATMNWRFTPLRITT